MQQIKSYMYYFDKSQIEELELFCKDTEFFYNALDMDIFINIPCCNNETNKETLKPIKAPIVPGMLVFKYEDNTYDVLYVGFPDGMRSESNNCAIAGQSAIQGFAKGIESKTFSIGFNNRNYDNRVVYDHEQSLTNITDNKKEDIETNPEDNMGKQLQKISSQLAVFTDHLNILNDHFVDLSSATLNEFVEQRAYRNRCTQESRSWQVDLMRILREIEVSVRKGM